MYIYNPITGEKFRSKTPPLFLTELIFSYKAPFTRVTKSKMCGDSNLSFTYIGTENIEGKIQETLISLESCHIFLYKL